MSTITLENGENLTIKLIKFIQTTIMEITLKDKDKIKKKYKNRTILR
jgi:hypothetical protein